MSSPSPSNSSGDNETGSSVGGLTQHIPWQPKQSMYLHPPCLLAPMVRSSPQIQAQAQAQFFQAYVPYLLRATPPGQLFSELSLHAGLSSKPHIHLPTPNMPWNPTFGGSLHPPLPDSGRIPTAGLHGSSGSVPFEFQPAKHLPAPFIVQPGKRNRGQFDNAASLNNAKFRKLNNLNQSASRQHCGPAGTGIVAASSANLVTRPYGAYRAFVQPLAQPGSVAAQTGKQSQTQLDHPAGPNEPASPSAIDAHRFVYQQAASGTSITSAPSMYAPAQFLGVAPLAPPTLVTRSSSIFADAAEPNKDLSSKTKFDTCAHWHAIRLKDPNFFVCMCRKKMMAGLECHDLNEITGRPEPMKPPGVLDTMTTLRRCRCAEQCECKDRNRVFQTKLMTNRVGRRLIRYRWCKGRKQALRGLQSYVMMRGGWLPKRPSDAATPDKICYWKRLLAGFGLKTTWYEQEWTPHWPSALLKSIGDGDRARGLRKAQELVAQFFAS